MRWGWVWVRHRRLKPLAYAWPSEQPLVVGGRVLVPLGKDNRLVMGLVGEAGSGLPPYSNLKPIAEVLDERPIYTEKALTFFQWLAFYYMTSMGDVVYLALPGRAGKIADWEIAWLPLPGTPPKPKRTYERLHSLGEHRLRKAAKSLGQQPKTLYQTLRRWEKQGLLRLRPIPWRPRPIQHALITLAPEYTAETAFQQLWETLPEKAHPHLLMLLQTTLSQTPLSYSAFLRKAGKVGRQLLRRGIAMKVPVRTYYETLYARPQVPYTLTPAQDEALHAILTHLHTPTPKPVLLHGVTASGKTFVYMEIIRRYLQKGLQVLYLLPEIALTKQTLDRLRGTFGEGMAVYHSSLSEAERFRVWRDIAEGTVDVIVGTRSALFLPFQRLGLIIVDEEHEPSYGQEGRPPRYQARDSAIYYAHLLSIPIVLGSATPAIETYYNAQQGRYHLVSLLQKAFPTVPPEVRIVDMRLELKEQLSQGVFSSVLLSALEGVLLKGQQAILFRNRRGYAPTVWCPTCGYHWECPHCDITLTFHKGSQKLLCHYCGHHEPVPVQCKVCGSENLRYSGVGTERIEEQLRLFLPKARVLRLDRDTAGSHRHEAIIAAFERGEGDILLGTQMVTKGLDFERVTLVGVLYGDSLLARPDFRAEERAYQLLVQLIGRAGRRGQAGQVIIQTFQPEYPLFAQLSTPYEAFYQRLLQERQTHRYPPFVRLLEITFQHKDPRSLEQQAHAFRQWLNQIPEALEILGPVYAPIARLARYYQMQIRLKLPPRYSLTRVREQLWHLVAHHQKTWGMQAARITFQVDP
jgi:primosomal protein N' (replication factor Y)